MLQLCPCCSHKPFTQCCGLYLSGQTYPSTAENLMRSRFTAYATGNLAYLRKSWHPDTCPDLRADDLTTDWCRLEIIKSKQGLKTSIVEFRAWYRDGAGNSESALHEISLFKQYKKRWVYVEPLSDWP
ncbi:YchJ family protein [Microbulbifer pacificus]|uniref:YchJ family protein n=1 Tax=Microbulbifer pacificus TaxID=407164 RepID=UPI000CF495F9|nr:YchJ family metal-binding protein [Microbulbifer pacificus]